MKRHLTDTEIRRLFSNPHSLRKGINLWKEAEKRGEDFMRNVKEQRKRLLERTA